MHILILPSWYPTQDNPINGIFFAEQAEALVRFGHRVSVISRYAEKNSNARSWVERREKNGVAEYAIHYRRSRVPGWSFVRLAGAMVRFLRHLPPGERPDIIHVHSFSVGRYACIIRWLMGIRYVVTEHATCFQMRPMTKREQRAVRLCYRQADVVIAVSEGLKKAISPYCSGEIQVIPNLVDRRFFSSRLHSPPAGLFRFVTVAGLDHKKGIDILLEAFAAVRKRGADVALTVCGDGPEREALEKLAEDLQVADRVRFVGRVSRDECVRYLEESQAFVLPSRAETFGIVFTEAMAKGLPVVMTKTDAWRELIAPETGLAVDINDVPALADAMFQMTQNGGRYDAKTIQAYCEARFSDTAVCARLTEIYTQVLGR